MGQTFAGDDRPVDLGEGGEGRCPDVDVVAGDRERGF